MEWRITLTVRKQKAVKEFLLAIEEMKSMLGQDVRIEQWDRKQLRDAEIRRWGGGSGWARWRWDGRNWFRENKKGELRAAGADGVATCSPSWCALCEPLKASLCRKAPQMNASAKTAAQSSTPEACSTMLSSWRSRCQRGR
jgi:hypothetical protein